MINKVAAQVRDAEVRGAMAAFVDAGLVKVASQDSFDQLCDVVAENIGINYDLEKIADVTEAVLSGGGMRKTAAQEKMAQQTACNAALGELLLMKTAGQIDNATFVREAHELMKLAKVIMEDEWTPKSGLGSYRPTKKSHGTATGRENARPFRSEGNLSAEGWEKATKDIRSNQAWAEAERAAQAANKAKLESINVKPKKALPWGKIGRGAAIVGGVGALGGGAYLGKSLYDKYYA